MTNPEHRHISDGAHIDTLRVEQVRHCRSLMASRALTVRINTSLAWKLARRTCGIGRLKLTEVALLLASLGLGQSEGVSDRTLLALVFITNSLVVIAGKARFIAQFAMLVGVSVCSIASLAVGTASLRVVRVEHQEKGVVNAGPAGSALLLVGRGAVSARVDASELRLEDEIAQLVLDVILTGILVGLNNETVSGFVRSRVLDVEYFNCDETSVSWVGTKDSSHSDLQTVRCHGALIAPRSIRSCHFAGCRNSVQHLHLRRVGHLNRASGRHRVHRREDNRVGSRLAMRLVVLVDGVALQSRGLTVRHEHVARGRRDDVALTVNEVEVE